MQLFQWLLASLLLSWIVASVANEATPAVVAPAATEKPAKEQELSPLAKGQALHQEHCVACHTAKNPDNPTALYTRKERKVTHYEGLKTQIQRCVTQLDLLWFEEEVANVATYLNTDYYHFELDPPK